MCRGTWPLGKPGSYHGTCTDNNRREGLHTKEGVGECPETEGASFPWVTTGANWRDHCTVRDSIEPKWTPCRDRVCACCHRNETRDCEHGCPRANPALQSTEFLVPRCNRGQSRLASRCRSKRARCRVLDRDKRKWRSNKQDGCETECLGRAPCLVPRAKHP